MRYRPDTTSSHASSQFLRATLEMAPDKNARMSGSAFKSGSNIRAFGTTIAKRHVRAAGNVGCKFRQSLALDGHGRCSRLLVGVIGFDDNPSGKGARYERRQKSQFGNSLSRSGACRCGVGRNIVRNVVGHQIHLSIGLVG